MLRFGLSNIWNKKSLLRFNLSYFWNKQRLLRFDFFQFLNKQSSLHFDLLKFGIRKVRLSGKKKKGLFHFSIKKNAKLKASFGFISLLLIVLVMCKLCYVINFFF